MEEPELSTLKHFIASDQLSLDETRALLDEAYALKYNKGLITEWAKRTLLIGKSLGVIFFDPSLRTRVTFDLAMQQLGGHSIVLDVGKGVWKIEHREKVVMDGDATEHLIEAAKVMSRYINGMAIRAFPEGKSWADDKLDPIINGFAKYATVPIISAESSVWHPCQGLADIMTIDDRLKGTKKEPIVITWAWHPKALPMAVPNSILMESAKFGMDVRLAHPPGWELDDDIMARARELSAAAGGSVRVYDNFEDALSGARVVYAKSWGSLKNYGKPEVEAAAKADLRDHWRVRMRHMERTDKGIFMHCLPTRRNVEVDGDVLDSPFNAAYDEAENRLHVQKAVLLRSLRAE